MISRLLCARRGAIAFAVAATAFAATPAAALSETYYVSPGGNDALDGKSAATAWKTLTQASGSAVPAGSKLLLQRGGTWAGERLIIGSSDVAIGSYGDPAASLPTLTDAPDTPYHGYDEYNAGCLIILPGSAGTFVEGLKLSSCSQSGARAGLVVRGDRTTVRGMTIAGNEAGVVLTTGADGNLFENNVLIQNNRMTVNTQGGAGDYGAYSFANEGGNNNEFRMNTITGAAAFSYDYGTDGSALEVYGGQGISFHHNFLDDNNASVEVAGANDVLVAYNRMSDQTVLHMKGRAGTSDRIRLYNNTAWLQDGKHGFYVGRGGRSTSVTLRNNIIKVEAGAAAGYSESVVNSDYNIYTGPAHGKWKMGPNDLLVDPQIDPSTWRLLPGSPAIDSGTSTVFTNDLDGNPLLRTPDRGAYEDQG